KMPPRMMTRSAGRATAVPRGGRTGGRTSRVGGRARDRSGDQDNGRIDGQGVQVGGQGSEIEKMESVQDMSGCRDNQKVKYTAGSFVDKALTWWNSQIHTQDSMSWLEPMTIQKAVQIAITLTDEAIRNGSLKKNLKKRRNSGEPSKDRNSRDDNKITRTGNAFTTSTNLVRRENIGHLAKD
ncbi:hypothetical protein Tco_1489079, partial [Tanacetum coccineum]